MVLEFMEYFELLNVDDPPLSDFLTTGWVPDPVLMPIGRPNVVEGVGAIYHFVKGSTEEIREYILRASPEVAVTSLERSLPAVGEFDGVDLTVSLPHGMLPDAAYSWRVYKVYEKTAVWLRLKKA